MFRNDYSEICAPEVLQAIADCGLEQNIGYGLDRHSESAANKILEKFGLTGKASVHFLAGGTQTNAVVISYFLRPYEAVIACNTGHINVHETGAVEGCGHKVLTVDNADGKIRPEDIEKIVLRHVDEHMVKPRMVYISDSTETGTVYTKGELSAIRAVCDKCGLLLFIDGARLGVALTLRESDVTCETIGAVADVFYVGGTKNGALFGEAVVIKNGIGAEDFRYHIKNRGAMLAKGFVCGLQFERLFTNDLYFELAKNSNQTADLIRSGLAACGVRFVGGSLTNQIFVQFPRAFAQTLMKRYGVELWEDAGEFLTVRIVTSFATKKEDCLEFVDYVRKNI